MKYENLEKHFELFEETNIALETPIREKRRIVEENKDKKALIEIKDIPDKYLLGRLEPKNEIFFGLRVIEPQVEMNCPEIIPYEDLLELKVCSSSPTYSNNHKR